MSRNRISKLERREMQLEKVERKLHGDGIYVYQNVTNGDLTLPKPGLNGRKIIRSKEKFEGDSYFMTFVNPPNNLLKLIEKLETIKENVVMTEKLILDQPEMVTANGTVEHVVNSKLQKINDSTDNDLANILLTEDPMEGVEIISD